MSDLKIILQEEYKKKKLLISPQSLMIMIEEAMEVASEVSALLERSPSPRTREFTYEAIPSPNVSELGWASMQSNDQGAAAKREELEQYLRVIPGTDLRVKLKGLQRMLTDPRYAMSLVSYGDSRGARIASALGYLVFFKMLTTVITNFNAASAGFNFEAFLAVLLGGSQIPAAGATTIADIVVRGTPISLKLYKEKTVKAGGSYNDLVADLAKGAGMMRYVVATKDLEGKDLDRRGTIEVYSYDLTPNNIVEILYASADHANSQLIRLPQSVVQGKKSLNFKVPKMPSFADIEERFHDELKTQLGDVDWYDNLIADLDYADNRQLFRKGKPGYEGFKYVGKSGRGTRSSPLLALLNDFIDEQNLELDGGELHLVIHRAQEAAREEYWKAVRTANKLGSGLGAFAPASTSRSFYNSLTSKAQKKRALLLTLGAVYSGNQYELRRADIYNIVHLAKPYNVLAQGQREVKIGELEIGREQVQDLLEQMVNDLNREVFEIFEQMSVMQRDLQGYFAGGLEDPQKADSAIKASLAVGTKTEKVKTDVAK